MSRMVRDGGSPDRGAFAERLRDLREAAGLSQADLAERARLSLDAVSALERGTRTHPYPATVRALADALSLRPSDRARLIATVPSRRTSQRPSNAGAFDLGQRDVPGTRLLGRDDDVSALRLLVTDPEARLVTLTGPGGVGKTRLAAAVAGDVALARGDEVAWLDLAPLNDDGHVVSELVRRLAGGDRAGGGDALDDVVTAVAGRQMLLVLDNCEHLTGVGPLAAGVVARCPGVAVLATSRGPLRVRGEREYRVVPLAVPDASLIDAAALTASPAAELFVERCRAVRHDLVLTAVNVAAIVSICRRLEGLPLALELAAAGIRTLEPPALDRRLGSVLQLNGPVDLPARQRTIRATLDWSYALLTDEEQTALRALSWFAAPFTLDAAEVVLGGRDALTVLDTLAGQSLCTAAVDSAGVTRFGMLAPVAEYGRALLDERERHVVGRTHCRYFLNRAEAVEPGYRGEDQLASIQQLDHDSADISAAFEWAVGAGDGELAGRFVWALWKYWWLRGRLDWARRLTEQTLMLDMPAPIRARTLVAAGGMGEHAQHGGLARRRYLEAIALAVDTGDRATEASAALALGALTLEELDVRAAEHQLARALSAAEGVPAEGPWLASHAHVLLGVAARLRGDPHAALPHLQAALELARARGDGVAMCVTLYNLAHTLMTIGDRRSARAQVLDAVRLCEQAADVAHLAMMLEALAAVEAPDADHRRTATLLGAAARMRESAGSARYGYYDSDTRHRDKLARRTREHLGPETYEQFFAVGYSSSLEGAAALVENDGGRGVVGAGPLAGDQGETG